MAKTIISGFYCNNYEPKRIADIVDEIFKALSVNSEIIKPNSKVLIKPNLLSAYTPDQAITTHPEIVRAVIRKVKSLKAVPVVGDSAGNMLRGMEYVWEKTGMLQVAKEENIELVNFETMGSVELAVEHPTIKNIYLTKALINCDYIINIPKVKTHTFMGFSCGIKNFYGCVPGARKVEYHKLAPSPYDFAKLLTEIYRIVNDKLILTIADGVWGLEGNGPSLSGIKRNFNMIVASRDTVTLDTFLLDMLGSKSDKKFIDMFKNKNLGNTDISNIIYYGDNVSLFNTKKVKFPSTWILRILPSKFALLVGKIFGRLIWIKPKIDTKKCVGCLQCMKSCPVKAIYKKNNSVKPVVDKAKCISCFCCHELCTHKAVKIEKSIIAGMFVK